MTKYYRVRWFDSPYYNSVNTVDYVMKIMKSPRPLFYQYLVYELIESDLSFRDLTLLAPFDKDFRKVSRLKLNYYEKALMKYHYAKLREAKEASLSQEKTEIENLIL